MKRGRGKKPRYVPVNPIKLAASPSQKETKTTETNFDIISEGDFGIDLKSKGMGIDTSFDDLVTLSNTTTPKGLAVFALESPRISESFEKSGQNTPSRAKHSHKKTISKEALLITEFNSRAIEGMFASSRKPPVMSARLAGRLANRLESALKTLKALSSRSTVELTGDFEALSQKLFQGIKRKQHLPYVKSSISVEKLIKTAVEFGALTFKDIKLEFQELRANMRTEMLNLSDDVFDLEEISSKLINGLKKKQLKPKQRKSKQLTTNLQKILSLSVEPSGPLALVEEFKNKIIEGLIAKKPKVKVQKVKHSGIEDFVNYLNNLKASQAKVKPVEEMMPSIFAKKVLQGLKICRSRVPKKSGRHVHLHVRQGGKTNFLSFFKSTKVGPFELEDSSEPLNNKLIKGLEGFKKRVPVCSSKIKNLLKIRHKECIEHELTESQPKEDIDKARKVITGLISKKYIPASSSRYVKKLIRSRVIKKPHSAFAKSKSSEPKRLSSPSVSNKYRAITQRIFSEKLRYSEITEISSKKIPGIAGSSRVLPVAKPRYRLLHKNR